MTELEISVALDDQGGGSNVARYPGPMLGDVEVESAEFVVMTGGTE